MKLKKVICFMLAICMALSLMYGMSVSSVSAANEKYIALTFDDGPNTSTCSEVLRKLKQYNVPATFFVNGYRINDSSGPLLQTMLDQGCQIGSHSYDHALMGRWTIDQLNADWDKVCAQIRKYVDYTPTIMRWPNLQIPNVWKEFAYPSFGGYCPNDWNSSVTQSQIETGVLNNAKDGQIIVLHCYEGLSKTVSALDTIIPNLLNQGYTFVTINELFEKQNQVMDTSVSCWNSVPRNTSGTTKSTSPTTTRTTAATQSTSATTRVTTSSSGSESGYSSTGVIIPATHAAWAGGSPQDGGIKTASGNTLKVSYTDSAWQYQQFGWENVQPSAITGESVGIRIKLRIDSVGKTDVPLRVKFVAKEDTTNMWYTCIKPITASIGEMAEYIMLFSEIQANGSALTANGMKEIDHTQVRVEAQDGSTVLGGMTFTFADIEAVKAGGGSDVTNVATTTTTTTKATTTTTTAEPDTTAPDTTTAEQPVIKGDLNRDSAVNIQDLLIMKKSIALESTTQKYADVADLNKDNAVNISDLLIMKKLIATA